MFERGFGEVAVRIEQGETFAGREVLPDQVEQKRAFAGAGLPDHIEMPAPLFRVEQDIAAQRVGADAELLIECSHSQNGAGVPCAPQLGTWCGQHPHSL